MKTKITIVLADDHPIFRKGLRQIIESDNTLKILAEAEDGESALQKIIDLLPDIAILDLDMPVKNGFDVAKSIREQSLSTEIIFLTMYKEEDMFNEAMDLGVMGYVLKENATGDILQSIKTVHSGKHYISPNISEYLISRSERTRTFTKRTPLLEQLTPSERRVLKLISENKTSAEIALVLHISQKTVENHRLNITSKLHLQGSHSLLKFALENKSFL
jgi:DNA-binding NarL/FixJ family response regulator